MKQILENLDLSEEVKAELSESFDKAVLVEAVKLAESKEEAYEAYMLDQMTEMKADLEDKLDAYLTRVVEEFVAENTFAIDESIKSEKYEAVLEGFNSMMIATGVTIANITEAKVEAPEVETIVVDNSEKVDALVKEILTLEAKNAELLKTGLIKESMENMTEMQKEKFLKLAKIVEFDAKNPVEFMNKLDTLAESVSVVKAIVKEEAPIVTESVVTSTKYVSAKNSHLY